MTLSRQSRRLSVLTALGILSVSACSDMQSPTRLIELAVSLQADAIKVPEANIPIVIFVSRHDCIYCERLREQVLYPMIRAGELENRIILRELSLDPGFSVEDFHGNIVDGKNFADRYDASITPTLLFLDEAGLCLSDPLVGTGNIEFYRFYLNRKIEEATQVLAAASVH